MLCLDWSRSIVRIDLDYVICTLTLVAKNLKSLLCIVRSDNTITYLTLDESSNSSITSIRKGDEVTIA